MVKKNLPFLFLGLLIIVVFHAWLTTSLIAGGDFWPIYPEQYANYLPILYAWNNNLDNGFGGSMILLSWNQPLITFPIAFWGNFLQLPYIFVERLGYLFPLLILLFGASFYSARILFQGKKILQLVSIIVFCLNTYILMVVGGGQVTIAFAYASAPLVIGVLTQNFSFEKELSYRRSLLGGVFLSLQIMLDLRIAYVTFAIIFLYFLFYVWWGKHQKSFTYFLFISAIKMIVLPLIVVAGAHIYWLLPAFIFHPAIGTVAGSAYTSSAAVGFLSFGSFEYAFSLLQPNWPENIFGKVAFLNPLFLMLPIMSFISLLFVPAKGKLRTNDKIIVFASILALIGAFLGKGTRDPFGSIYLFLFLHFPGFILFRDSTKWYLFVAFAYSVLIPFSILHVCEWLSTKRINSLRIKSKKMHVKYILFILLLIYLIFLIKPAITGQLTGIMQTTRLPVEYVQFKSFFVKDSAFSRTLWVPSLQRFGYVSPNHPGVSAYNYFDTSSLAKVLNDLKSSHTQQMLQDASIGYIIVPYDVNGELFVQDRTYDGDQYIFTIRMLRQVSWLHEISGFGKIHVFKIENPKPLLWTIHPVLQISVQQTQPTRYKISVNSNSVQNTLVFSQNFDPNWVLQSGTQIIHPTQTINKFMRFSLPREPRTFILFYEPQTYMIFGSLFSLVTLLIVCIVVLGRKTW